MANGRHLQWVTTSYLCYNDMLYVKYANVKKENGELSHSYFIDVKKDKSFYLHMVEFGAEKHMQRFAQLYNTLEAAEMASTKHYLNYLGLS